VAKFYHVHGVTKNGADICLDRTNSLKQAAGLFASLIASEPQNLYLAETKADRELVAMIAAYDTDGLPL